MFGLRHRRAPIARRLVALTPVSAMALGLLSACGGDLAAVQIADRTYRIEGPGLPSAADAPPRRLAERACPLGYRVLDQRVRRNSPDGIRDEVGMFTTWTIRCI